MTKNRIVKVGGFFYPQHRSWKWPFWTHYMDSSGDIAAFPTHGAARTFADCKSPAKRNIVEEW
jgi:hypothetical protein